jgi:hypothetical protein
MDIDDEDAFLYGDSEPIDAGATGGAVVNDVVKTEEAKQNAQRESRGGRGDEPVKHLETLRLIALHALFSNFALYWNALMITENS